MDEKRKTVAAVAILVGLFLLIAIVVGVLISSRRIVSPVPDDDDAIKIIFVSPSVLPTSSVTPTPTKKL